MGEDILGIGNMGAGGGFGSGSGGFSISNNRWTKHSDQSIKENVDVHITGHSEISPAAVQSQVKDGVVILSGIVSNQKIKDFLEDEIEVLPGVHQKSSQVFIRSPPRCSSSEK